ncbi:hypothetical protein VNO78_16405 [Psophocarpus tetragonolobus]|uniref:Uncharacterized protein n=1 Tax=Psophocarpus tetragonolobus TaxID=3891 RepID=A0AAN9XKM8_PSOTE
MMQAVHILTPHQVLKFLTNPTRNRSHATNFNISSSFLLCQPITNFTKRNRLKIVKANTSQLLNFILQNQKLQNLLPLPCTDSTGEDLTPHSPNAIKVSLGSTNFLASNELLANFRQSISEFRVEFAFSVPLPTSYLLGRFKFHSHQHLLGVVHNLLHDFLGKKRLDGFLQQTIRDVGFSFKVSLSYPHLLPPTDEVIQNMLLVGAQRNQVRSFAFPLQKAYCFVHLLSH